MHSGYGGQSWLLFIIMENGDVQSTFKSHMVPGISPESSLFCNKRVVRLLKQPISVGMSPVRPELFRSIMVVLSIE